MSAPWLGVNVDEDHVTLSITRDAIARVTQRIKARVFYAATVLVLRANKSDGFGSPEVSE